MHFSLTVVLTQDVAGLLRARARTEGFVDIRHLARDVLYRYVDATVPAAPPKPPSMMPPTQAKILTALRDGPKPLSVADFIRSTGFSHQACHMNTKALADDGLVEVVSQHSDGSPGAPRKYYRATEAGLARLALVEDGRRQRHEELQRTAEVSALATGAAVESGDAEEMEELRAVRARHAAKRTEALAEQTEQQSRQQELLQAWDDLPARDFDRMQLLMLILVWAKTRSFIAVNQKADTVVDIIKRRFLAGETVAQIKDDVIQELEPFGGEALITEQMKAARKADAEAEAKAKAGQPS